MVGQFVGGSEFGAVVGTGGGGTERRVCVLGYLGLVRTLVLRTCFIGRLFIALGFVCCLVACASHLLLFPTSFSLFFPKVISLPILFRVSFIGLDACAPHFA